VRVDHSHADVIVTQQLLDGADVAAIFEEMRRKGVAEGVTGGSLGETRPTNGFGDSALHHRLVEVMPAALGRHAVDVDPGGREDPVPCPRPSTATSLGAPGKTCAH
jgi:hypothetical protein